MVEGVKHTRLTTHWLSKGQITLPSPGGGAAPAPVDSGSGVGPMVIRFGR